MRKLGGWLLLAGAAVLFVTTAQSMSWLGYVPPVVPIVALVLAGLGAYLLLHKNKHEEVKSK